VRSFDQLQADLEAAERDLRAAHLDVEAVQQRLRDFRKSMDAERAELHRRAVNLLAALVVIQREVQRIVVQLEVRASAVKPPSDRSSELLLIASDLRRLLLDVRSALGSREDDQ
jgi:multidrug resistance efflux pump